MNIKDKYSAPSDVYCPLWRKPMSKCCHKCAWFKEIEGLDSNTGEKVREWNCAVNWQNMLGIENSKEQRVTAAEVAELRNEIGAAKKTAQAIKAHEAKMLGYSHD